MKRFLQTISNIVLGIVLLSTSACSNSDVDKEIVTPSFPAHTTLNVAAGTVHALTIEPNMAWEVSVPTSTATFFQILDGENKVYTLRGAAGRHEIKINVGDIEDFDNDHSCDVTMTMGGESQVIATITLPKTQREIAIYPVKIEDNTFGFSESEEMIYAYESEQVGEDGMTMIWPEGMGLFSTRVKVVSNIDWIVDGAPAWITPIEGSKAGEMELWIKGEASQYPMTEQSATLSFVDAANTDKVVTTLKVTIPAATSVFSVDGFGEESLFNSNGEVMNQMLGEYVEGTANGTITATNAVSLYTIEFTTQMGMVMPTLNPEWVTTTLAEWDNDDNSVIQSRVLNIGTGINDGSSAREAIVLAVPAHMATDDVYSFVAIIDGMPSNNINDEYSPYIVTKVKQESAPGSISILNEESMTEVGATFSNLEPSHWIFSEYPTATEGYNLLYTKPRSHEGWTMNIDRTYTTITCYTCNAAGIVEMSGDNAWITVTPYKAETETEPQAEGDATSLRIEMDITKPTAADAINILSGDYEGVVTIADAEGVFAIIYCRYNPNTVIGSTSLAFAYPESAQSTDHSSLVELTEGDLYQSYYTKYSAPVYHLTYTTTAATMSMLTGLTESYELDNEADKSWLSYEYSEEWQMVVMKAEGNGKTGAIVFKNILGENKLVLLCTLNLAK